MESMDVDRDKSSSAGEAKQEAKPIVVMLIGVPGSGKSTFCDQVMRMSTRPGLESDSINNGKTGTKTQCLSSATRALADGKSVLIDRCNINREQRADFLKLTGEQVEKHALVLDLPAKLCISRSVKRIGHEGKLQGGKAASVVNQMLQKKEHPNLSEGFTRITFCQNEKDVKEAADIYGSLGPSDSLPSGCVGEKNSDRKVQLGIMKFLKKVDTSGNGGLEQSVSAKSVANKMSTEKSETDSRLLGTEMCSNQSGDAFDKRDRGDEVDEITNFSGTESDNVPTLAFPSISTADFQFDLEKASDIIVEKVEEYTSRIGKARLVLVDLSQGSKILTLVKAKAAQKNTNSDKFFTFVGDITQLRTKGGLQCNVIANAANWRLKPGGGGVNAAIFNAAGSALEIATKERASSLKPGKAVVVALPSSSPLFIREGVAHVIHVLGPNMNPNRPDCLKNDYVQGCKILNEAYTSLFEGFMSIVRSTSEDQTAKRGTIHESDKNKRFKGSEQSHKPANNYLDDNKNKDGKGSDAKRKTWASWALALYNIVRSPDKHMNVALEMSEDVIVIKDAYPKAKQHLLVIARVHGLDSIVDVSREHASLLKTMHGVGLRWADKSLNEDRSMLFRLGYHSVPSMRQLHLHLISQDFDSNHLKNKKHWNSFNTPFFLDSVDVISELDDAGKVTPKDEKFLEMELRCHKCRSVHPNIPRLKSHIRSCEAPFQASLLLNGRLVSHQSSNSLSQ